MTIRRLGSEPQIEAVHVRETEHVEEQISVPTPSSQELERPSRSDRASLKSESDLSGQARQSELNRQLLENRADELFIATDGVGTNEESIFRNLSGLTAEQRKELNEIYKQKFGQSLEQLLREELSGEDLTKALNLLNGKGPTIENRADAIHKACEGIGTDERAIFQNLSGLSAEQRKELNQVYKQKFGISLEQQFREEMSGPELDKALSLLNSKNGSQELEHKSATKIDKTDDVEKAKSSQVSKTLAKGSQGTEVAKLQTQMNEWRILNGKTPIAVDGKFGPETEKAIKEFQLANGLTSDGIAGPKTSAQLERELVSKKVV